MAEDQGREPTPAERAEIIREARAWAKGSRRAGGPMRCEYTLPNGDDCRAPARYAVGGGAAAAWYYCEDHAKHICACEARILNEETENEHDADEYHSRTECTGPEGFQVTRSAGTAGGSLMGEAHNHDGRDRDAEEV